jgi:hypothetical protein
MHEQMGRLRRGSVNPEAARCTVYASQLALVPQMYSHGPTPFLRRRTAALGK